MSKHEEVPISFAAAKTITINASADIVWDTLLNVASYEELFRTCSRVEPLPVVCKKKTLVPMTLEMLKRVKPGMRWIESRNFNTLAHALVVTATTVQVDAATGHHTFSVATEMWQSVGTSTHVLEVLDDAVCRLTIVYAMVPHGCLGSIYLKLFRKRLNRDATGAIDSDLKDVKDKAEQQQESTA